MNRGAHSLVNDTRSSLVSFHFLKLGLEEFSSLILLSKVRFSSLGVRVESSLSRDSGVVIESLYSSCTFPFDILSI
jgi:hypothetical protein